MRTNSIESLWVLFKLSIRGAFYHVSAKYLDRNLKDLVWRFSNRKNQYLFMGSLQRLLGTPLMTYQQLMGKAA